MVYDFMKIDFNNIPDCMYKVIALLAEAGTLMSALVNMPFVDPNDPLWDEFEKRPHIHELAEVLFAIHDTAKLAKKTLREIKGGKVNP